MAYRDMTHGEMVVQGEALLDANTRTRLSQESLLAPLLALLEGVVEQLRGAIEEGDSADDVKAINERLAVLDALHDRKLRGVYYGLKAAEGGDDPMLVTAAEAALALLFPDGLSITQANYQAEGNRAQLTENILDEDTEDTLRGIQIHGGNACGWLHEAIAAAKQLAALDKERTQLLKGTPPSGGSAAARLQWLNIVKSLDRLASLSGLSPEEVRLYFGPLRDAAKEAGKRP